MWIFQNVRLYLNERVNIQQKWLGLDLLYYFNGRNDLVVPQRLDEIVKNLPIQTLLCQQHICQVQHVVLLNCSEIVEVFVNSLKRLDGNKLHLLTHCSYLVRRELKIRNLHKSSEQSIRKAATFSYLLQYESHEVFFHIFRTEFFQLLTIKGYLLVALSFNVFDVVEDV